ncbi:MAG: ABC transporter ATP-binding protein [Phycisphaerales bacterium]
MAGVTLTNLTKIYEDGFTAVRDISLHIDPGSFVVLVGPSGCGKSTTLRMIAGLETITSGELKIGNRVVNAVRPKDRDIAMVFQNYALYPHLSVAENMGFSLRMSGVDKASRKSRVLHAADMLGLNSILSKKPGQLSGGQRQRVALGRAIVREPEVFLFDEPLSNLDPDRRVTTRAEIRRIVRELGTTSVYVTHDHEEAMALGDIVVVMKEGAIEQAGPPADVYAQPKTQFVGRFLGSPKMNIIECGLNTRAGKSFAIVENSVAGEHIEIKINNADSLNNPSRPVMGIRPQHIGMDTVPSGHIRLGRGIVEHVEYLGFTHDLTIKVGNNTLLVRDKSMKPRSIGDQCTLSLDSNHVFFF